MIPFYWYDLLIIPGIIQGLFLAVFLLGSNRTNKAANRTLSWMLFLAAFMLISRLIWNRYPSDWPIPISLVGDTPIFLFGPLFLYYIKRLLYQSKKSKRIPYYHFLPAAFHLAKSLYYLSLPQDIFSQFIKGSGFLDFPLTEVFAIVHNLCYWIVGYRLLTYYSRNEKNVVSFNQIATKFLKHFQQATLLCICIWLASFLSGVVFGLFIPLINYDTIWISISLLTYLIGYYNLKQPELFRLQEPLVSNARSSNRIKKEEIEFLNQKLTKLMNVEKIFLNNGLTLTKLATLLGTSQNNISWLLNEIHGKNFYDYVNHHRINEFKSKVFNNEHLKKTILAMALEVGFNSKSTFNKSFQLEMNDAPSSYIKKRVSIQN